MAARAVGGVRVSVSHEAPLRSRSGNPVTGLLAAAHLGPALAVTVMVTAYAAALDLAPARVALVGTAVLAGQLSIGWSNDLVDLHRDREVARADKPLATGAISVRAVRTACAVAVLLAVGLSLACGPVAGVLHLGLVAAGWAYNLGLKATALSWLPYAVAFGGLPVFVHLAGDVDLTSPTVPVATALLGVGAHLLNALPDLADDRATGVVGLPHRLGARWAPRVAVAALAAATVVLVLESGAGTVVRAAVLAVVLLLATLAVTTSGRRPFQAAVAIAMVDVLLVVAAA